MARVLLFGRLQDIAGWRERSVEPTPPTVAALLDQLAAEDEALGEALRQPSVRVAVDRQITAGDTSLAAAREIAFMPPMSGG
ncbi:MAG: MoaD/ThiS family protein [Caulobacteraceae bacterium]